MGPDDCLILAHELHAGRAGAAVARVSILSNPIGAEGATALIDVYEKNPKLLTLLGIEEGVTEVNFMKKKVDVGQCMVLAAELRAGRVTAATVEVNVSLNDIGVDGAKALAHVIPSSSLKWIVIGSKATRIPLHNAEVTLLNLDDQSLGPAEVIVVAAAISTNAAVAHIVLSGNRITGSTKRYGSWHKFDLDLSVSGIIAFGKAALVSKSLTSIDFSNCGISVAGIAEVAKLISAGAGLNNISVGMNDIGSEGGAILMSAACETSRARLRASQVLAFSKVLHDQLGSDCTLDLVADVGLGIATAVHSMHGHGALCHQLAQAGEPWFEVIVEGLDEEGLPPS
jgi:hypothetical protein